MTPPLSNDAIASLLERHGRLLVVAGESPFRARAFERAAESVRLYPEPLARVAERGDLTTIPGVGEGIAYAISRILATGAFPAHDELTRRIPESIIELTTIPGVGAKTALKLYSTLGIDSLDALESALEAGEIANAKVLSARIEATVRDGLATIRRRTGRTPLGAARPVAQAFTAAYSQARPMDRVALAGSARRWEVTIGDLDFVVASDDVDGTLAALAETLMLEGQERIGSREVTGQLPGGIRADITIVPPSSWGSALVRATGSVAHLERLGEIPDDVPTEEAVYGHFGLPWIPPELRAGDQEFARWREIPGLVTIDAINGEFHAHTTWSDGGASVAEMARAAAARGYSILGITDHSQSLGVAGGLDVERLAAQRLEIDTADMADGVKLLAGAEVEVHRDGALDYDDATLAELDVVVASLHTGLRQPREVLMARLERVLRNPNVDIIAHPSGRLIERREGGDFDWDRAFALAAETGTALEINADPARLDLDPSLAARASAAGCLITINCDAHSTSGFAMMEYGVAMARKAWLKPDQILNCWPREQILEWLAARGRSS
jgi:DNA polymerase (family 10)